METFLKINQQCIQNLFELNTALGTVETRGDSTMIMYKIRLMLSATLEQIQKDNIGNQTTDGSKLG